MKNTAFDSLVWDSLRLAPTIGEMQILCIVNSF